MPSGVSYVLENRDLMKRTFPQVFEGLRVRPVDDYPEQAARDARSDRAARRRPPSPRSCCSRRACTTRPTSSTASWRSRWASSWSKGATWSSRTSRSACAPPRACARVDVIYRRIDDDFLDPADLPPRLAARRARPDGRLSRRQCRAGQRARQRRRRRQGDLRLRAGHDPLLPGRGSDPAQRADLPLLARDGPPARAAESRQAGGQGANEAGGYGMLIGPHSTARRARGVRRQDHRQSAQLHRAAHAGACPACPRSSTTSSKAATSICAPTFSTARTSTSCPAG